MVGGIGLACCSCGAGEDINFRVYDFGTGQILWQAYLTEPQIAIDGTVWSQVATTITHANHGDNHPAQSALVLSAGPFDEADVAYSIAMQQRDAYTGEVLFTGSVLEYAGVFLPGVRGRLQPSRWGINANGHRAQGLVTNYDVVVVDDGTSNVVQYLIGVIPQQTGNVSITAATTGTALATHSTATWATDATAAAVESAITSAFGTNVVAVTVTGGPSRTAPMQIEIEWNHADYYLGTIDVNVASGPQYGGSVIRDLTTGDLLSHSGGATSNSYRGAGYWATDGNVITEKPVSTNATLKRLRSYDVSTFLWAENWNAAPLAGDVIVEDEVSFDDKLAPYTDGTVVAMAYPLRGPAGGPFASVSWFALDGTGRVDTDILEYAPNRAGIAVQDGGTDLGGLSTNWLYQNTSPPAGDALYYSRGADDIRRFSNAGVVSHNVMSGRMAINEFSGFDGTAVASIGVVSANISTVEKIATSGPDGTQGGLAISWTDIEEVAAAGLTPAHRIIHYHLFAPLDFQVASCEWRIEWGNNPDAPVLATAWLAHTATQAQAQTALDNLVGLDIDGNHNAEFELTGTIAAPLTPMVWQNTVTLNCIAAKNSTDATAQDWEPEFIGQAVNALQMRVRLRDVVLHQQKTIGAINWTTGAVVWERNWHLTGGSDNTIYAALKSGLLYASGDTHAGQSLYSELGTGLVSFDSAAGSQTEIWLGNTTSQWWGYGSWGTVDIAQGTQIEKATLILTPYAVTAGTATYTVTGTTDAAPTNRTAIEAMTVTTATASAVLDDAVQDMPLAVDVTAIVQEMLDAVGWTSGDSIGLRLAYVSASAASEKMKVTSARLNILYS